ncbi:hypothetical protein JXA47_04055 [Candidatus Sumerlaeota bacterium]|nr:hypothetical protein [Candidatus Sumerlaeota bacterium]
MTERRRLPEFIPWVALALALPTLWASTAMWRFAVEAIEYPYQLDPIEGKILQQALWMQEGRTIYFALGDEPPWIVGNYPPLYPRLCALGVDPALPDFAWPRELALLSTLVAGLAMAGLVWHLTRHAGWALLGMGLWWSSYEVYYWTPLCRVDLPALALASAGLLVGVMSLGRWSWRRVVIVSGLFWLAWLTRQSQVLFPAALILFLALTDRGWAWRLAMVWALGLAVLLGLLCLITGGQFWVHTVRYNVNVWSWDQTWVWIRHLWRMWHWGLMALALGWGVWLTLCRALPADESQRERRVSHGITLLTLALLLNLLNVMATGKVGADKNYLLEPLWCLCGLLPLVWHRVALAVGDGARDPRWAQRSLAVTLVTLTAALALQVWCAVDPLPRRPWHRGLWSDRSAWRPPITRADLARDLEIQGIFDAAEGPVLSEYGIYTLRSGREMLHEPFLMSQLARQGLWDETPLLDRIRRGEFALILVRDDFRHAGQAGSVLSATPELIEAVNQRFTLERSWPQFVIPLHLWRPREASDQPPG